MHIDWFTFFAQVVNFLILIFLLKRFLYKPVVEAMDRREEMIAGRIEEARLKLTEAHEKESEFEKKLRDFDRRKEEMEERTKEEVELKKQEMMREARAEIESLQQRWNEALDGERASFIRELQMEAGDNILDIVQQILTDLADADLEAQSTEIFIRQLSAMDRKENRKLIASALDYGEGKISVKSSFELDEREKKRIEKLLKQKVAAGVECDFEVVPALGFGIELRAGGWRAGWSLNGYIGKLRERLEQELLQRAYGKAPEPGTGTVDEAIPASERGTQSPGSDN